MRAIAFILAVTLPGAALASPLCKKLSADFDQTMRNIELARPASRSRNRFEAMEGSSAMTAERSAQRLILDQMRDEKCPLPKNRDSMIYAVDAQRCLIERMIGSPEAEAFCDQSKWPTKRD